MTTISTDEVRALARLSALRLSDEEATGLTTDLENIIGYFSLLEELDTDGVEPTYYGMDLVNVSRSDEVKDERVKKDDLLNLSAGGIVADQFKVPKVL